MKQHQGVTIVEISMALVVLAIVAVVALPTLQQGTEKQVRKGISLDTMQAVEKVKSAYANAIANYGGYPQLNQLVEYIDADFASESNDLGGVVFWGYKKRVMVNTYNDENCNTQTSGENPGVSDVVRCIKPGASA